MLQLYIYTFPGELLSMGYVEQLITLLSSEKTGSISREHCTAGLLGLASSYPPALTECMRPELHLKHYFTTRLKEIKAKQESMVSCDQPLSTHYS